MIYAVKRCCGRFVASEACLGKTWTPCTSAASGKIHSSTNVSLIWLKLPYHESKQVTNPGIGVRFETVRGHRGRLLNAAAARLRREPWVINKKCAGD